MLRSGLPFTAVQYGVSDGARRGRVESLKMTPIQFHGQMHEKADGQLLMMHEEKADGQLLMVLGDKIELRCLKLACAL